MLLKKALDNLKNGEHDWPPIINLDEAGGYYFEVGSAKLSAEFETKLKGDISPIDWQTIWPNIGST
jgi:hypothetical protein